MWLDLGIVGQKNRGVWKKIGQCTVEVCVWNESYLNEVIKFFEDINDYMNLREWIEKWSERFSEIKHKYSKKSDYFKRNNLRGNYFMRVVKDWCAAESIYGSGDTSRVTTHELCGSLETLLFEVGNEDSSVELRTGNSDSKSLKSY